MSSCFLTPETSPLKGKKGVLIRLAGLPADFPEGLPDIAFDDTGSITGFTGCNRFFGNYNHPADSSNSGLKPIKITPTGMTKKFCMDVNEQGFLSALEATETYELRSDTLIFFHKNRETAAFKLETKP